LSRVVREELDQRMSRSQGTSRKGGPREAALRVDADLRRHLRALNLPDAAAYREWCRTKGFGDALHKGWREREREVAASRRASAEASAGAELARHLRALGMPGREEYEEWCAGHGFSTSLHKTREQRRQEQTIAERERAAAAMTRARRAGRRPREIIQSLAEGEPLDESVRSPVLARVAAGFASLGSRTRERDAYRRLLLHLEEHARLLESVDPVFDRALSGGDAAYVDGLLALARHCREWVREPEEWRPPSRGARKQFHSLARHLVARYSVPVFMDLAWFEADATLAARHQEWFKHIGRGQNIRTADVPVRVTKMASHHFAQVPEGWTIEQALRWGQVRALGGSEALARAVMATRLGHDFENEEFWTSVLHFFVNNPMLDLAWVGPIVDFIHERRHVPQEIVHPGGVVETLPPIEPAFTMKGRTVDALLKRVEEWHRELAGETRDQGLEWTGCGIAGFEAVVWDDLGRPVRWTITEVCRKSELREEGHEMRHCVASYARSCAKGRVSVWSLKVQEGENAAPRRVMTIAVNNVRRAVTEARGRCNKLPGARHTSVRLDRAPEFLRQWAAREGLSLPKHASPFL
jgi:hypothetical protein